jgi:hypothetical protein
MLDAPSGRTRIADDEDNDEAGSRKTGHNPSNIALADTTLRTGILFCLHGTYEIPADSCSGDSDTERLEIYDPGR